MAIAGFSAIVVLFKRRADGVWEPGDADRFNGMLLHAVAAAFFCLLPAIVSPFARDPSTVWRICSGVLGVQILLHAGVIIRLPSSGRAMRAWLVIPLVVAGLQGANALGRGFDGESGPYLVGVIWHILQAGLLFVLLVWVRQGTAGRLGSPGE